jgi:hypothetical protein
MRRLWWVVGLMSLVLAGCASDGMYERMPTQRLDAEAASCQNGACQYDIGMAYLKRGQAKGWAYIDLSAREGYPPARAFLVNNGRAVPAKNPDAAYGG